MSLNKDGDRGFVMMESLVSLSILALFVGVVFPFSMDLLKLRETAKEEIELSRFLYEDALFYDRDEPDNKTYLSGNVRASSVETPQSIRILHQGEPVRTLLIYPVDW